MVLRGKVDGTDPSIDCEWKPGINDDGTCLGTDPRCSNVSASRCDWIRSSSMKNASHDGQCEWFDKPKKPTSTPGYCWGLEQMCMDVNNVDIELWERLIKCKWLVASGEGCLWFAENTPGECIHPRDGRIPECTRHTEPVACFLEEERECAWSAEEETLTGSLDVFLDIFEEVMNNTRRLQVPAAGDGMAAGAPVDPGLQLALRAGIAQGYVDINTYDVGIVQASQQGGVVTADYKIVAFGSITASTASEQERVDAMNAALEAQSSTLKIGAAIFKPVTRKKEQKTFSTTAEVKAALSMDVSSDGRIAPMQWLSLILLMMLGTSQVS